MNPIERAIQAAGGRQNELAKSLGITPQQLNQWVTGLRPVPAHHCVAIEAATGGEVTRYELRPDVFGERADDSSRQLGAANDGDAAGTQTSPLKVA